jgi:hypothetical protein
MFQRFIFFVALIVVNFSVNAVENGASFEEELESYQNEVLSSVDPGHLPFELRDKLRAHSPELNLEKALIHSDGGMTHVFTPGADGRVIVFSYNHNNNKLDYKTFEKGPVYDSYHSKTKLLSDRARSAMKALTRHEHLDATNQMLPAQLSQYPRITAYQKDGEVVAFGYSPVSEKGMSARRDKDGNWSVRSEILPQDVRNSLLQTIQSPASQTWKEVGGPLSWESLTNKFVPSSLRSHETTLLSTDGYSPLINPSLKKIVEPSALSSGLDAAHLTQTTYSGEYNAHLRRDYNNRVDGEVRWFQPEIETIDRNKNLDHGQREELYKSIADRVSIARNAHKSEVRSGNANTEVAGLKFRDSVGSILSPTKASKSNRDRALGGLSTGGGDIGVANNAMQDRRRVERETGTLVWDVTTAQTRHYVRAREAGSSAEEAATKAGIGSSIIQTSAKNNTKQDANSVASIVSPTKAAPDNRPALNKLHRGKVWPKLSSERRRLDLLRNPEAIQVTGIAAADE